MVTHAYKPRGVLAELFRRNDPEILIAGPAGTGKSMACLEKMHLAALRVPGMRGLIVRKTLRSLGGTALTTWRKRVVIEALEARVLYFYGGSAEEPPQYRYVNGSVIQIGGLDHPDKIMSSEFDLIYVNEATGLLVEDWQALVTRLRYGKMRTQQLIADCNPSKPTHFLKARSDEGQLVMLESRHTDNPTLYHDDGTLTEIGAAYMAKLDSLTGVRKLRLRYGLWVGAEGLVYSEYDPSVHVVKPFRVPDEWPRYWSIDFGYTNPFVWQCWVEDPEGRLYLHREIYRTGRLVEDHARDILDVVSDPDPDYVHPEGEPRYAHQGRIWREEEYPAAIICDHDAEDRATLKQHLGIGTVAARKSVTLGIQRTESRFKVQEDGMPRLFFMDSRPVHVDASLVSAGRPSSTVEEIAGYVWDVRDGRPPKEVPMKEGDHGMDAMRYMVMHRHGKSGGVRFL